MNLIDEIRLVRAGKANGTPRRQRKRVKRAPKAEGSGVIAGPTYRRGFRWGMVKVRGPV